MNKIIAEENIFQITQKKGEKLKSIIVVVVVVVSEKFILNK
jgi:hypothetical protein